MALIIPGLTLLLDGILIDVNKTSQVVLGVGGFFWLFSFLAESGELYGDVVFLWKIVSVAVDGAFLFP